MDNTLQSAVYTPETNLLLKKMLNQFNKYSGPRVVKFLGVDIENAKPIYFNGMEYKKAQHEEYLFFFLDEKCKVMGILKGNTWNKGKYSEFEHYYHSSNWGSNWVKKSRKGLTEAATHILMITSEMRTKTQKTINKPKNRFRNERDARISLDQRLQQYKLQKHNEITYEQVLQISQDMIIYVAQNLFNPELEETLPRKMRCKFSFCDDMHKLLTCVTDLSRDYYRIYKEYQEKVAKKDQLRDGEWEYFSQWRMSELNTHKANIITIKSMIKGE